MSFIGFAQQLRETQVLTSNNIIALAGSGDTLWIATERGFNYRIGFQGDTWHGFEDSELSHRLWGFAFGGGGAAAIVSNNNSSAHHNYIGFWHFDHIHRRQQERYFGFPVSMQNENGDLPVPTGNAIYAGGSFWVPFGKGGIVRYNPEDNIVHTIPSQSIGGENTGGADTRDVLSLDVLRAGAGSGSLILVTTPTVIWTYNPNNNDWHALHNAPTLSTSQEVFISFNAAFLVAKNETLSTLYSFITTTLDNENNTVTMLYRFDDNEGQWLKALDRRERFSIFPAAGGSMYTLFEGNAVGLYADVDNGVTGGSDGYLSEILNRDQFRQMLARAGNDPNPRINDILFLSHTDSSGALAVATTTGLYISENVEPLRGAAGHGDFTLTHHVREVGVGQAYALPGIMRASIGGIYDRSVFVYRLRNDGNVTIRVYDYNMSLVRTVIRGERRSSNAQRSTDPSRDFWDGTNQAGRRVSPGVYYFRITSTGGDRFVGRVIVAK
jgi:hypothetical protein